jgi:hypothetical protein
MKTTMHRNVRPAVIAAAAICLAAAPLGISVAHADWIPCDIQNSTLYATTPNSHVEVCSVNGSWVYQGKRLRDGSNIVLTTVATFPNAGRIEAYNDGWTYSLRRDGFHLISPGGVDNYEPWVSIHTWNMG